MDLDLAHGRRPAPVLAAAADPSAAAHAPATPLRGRPGPEGRAHRVDLHLTSAFVVLIVLTQRVGVPFGATAISVALPLTYLFVVTMAVRHRLTFSRIRAELYWIAVALVLAATAAVGLTGGTFSTDSLYLLLAIYFPWILRMAWGNGAAVVHRAGRTFVWVMVVVGALGAFQLASQLAGVWDYRDLVGEWLPPDLQVPGYNTTIPLVWDSPVIKGNGFILLEPSFLSQFCALAIIIAVVLRMRVWAIVVLLAGVVSSVSGTGLMLLMAGGLLLLFRARRRIRPGYIVAAGVGAVLLLLGPTAPFLLERSDELSTSGSSGDARFIAPYSSVAKGLEQEPERYAVGAGPGNEQILILSGDDEARYANYSIVPKLLFEYGLVAGGAFILFLLVAQLDRTPWRVVPGALVVLTFVLSGALLQPQTASLAWVLSGLGSSDRHRPDAHDG